ncbi:glycoside hydrolase family 3 protein [Nitrospirillum iridis]|uniref:Beta-glucosidase n=1 Tax=Nitrospirillum iridis TaxID=765888 RepID=A0A7X0AWS8_9PROT|nr:glycoside hydrolase family 3 protein [Nitrospirillum iridis]MBB6251162.1 beta-glucosidase [Nitrospirillum iridis]
MIRRLSLAGVALLSLAPAAGAQTADSDALVSRMTLAEKVGQIQSAAPAIPRLGLPSYEWWNEGLHGVARAGYATVFPQAIGLAATWDADVLRRVGDTVSTEARAKYNAGGGAKADHDRYQGLTIWSPNINIFRDPRWGRGQETYGEDPYLTGRLGVAFIQGIQGPDPAHPKAIATAKHFVVHSGPEAGRHAFDVDVAPHDLEATYLPAFRAAVTEGQVGSIMCAYNALHGTPVCADPELLNGRLRRDWGFKGYVVSDCDAVDDMTRFHHYRPDNAASAAAALLAGTDLNCGGGGRYAYADLGAAVSQRLVTEGAVDQAARRVMAARARLGAFAATDPYADIGTERIDDPAARALALEAARKSIVLLKNRNNALPLAPGVNLAVVGPNADALGVLEANYHGTMVEAYTPLAALRMAPGVGTVRYAQGSTLADGVPVLVPETALRTGAGSGAEPGLTGDYFDNTDFSGEPRLTRTDRTVDFDWDKVPPVPGMDAGRYAVRWTGLLVPPGAGDYTLAVRVDRCFDCAGHDAIRLYLDGRLVLDDPGTGKDGDLTVRLHAEGTAPHRLRLELVHSGQDQGVRLQWLAPADVQRVEAVAATRGADAIVAFVGLSPDLEGEELGIAVPGFDGGDRTDIDLPQPQRQLLEALAATGKPLVVVLMSGSAVALNWAQDHADAILAAWYPGERGGRAIAETLTGANNPSGRLPVTFYRSVRDLPPFVDYAMTGRTYRYFQGTPLYPFGFGLSYTRFTYDDLTLSAEALPAGQPLTATAMVRNVGDRGGEEVVQLYVTPPSTPLAPRRQLVGFQRVRLEPGESKRVTFQVQPRDISAVDAAGNRAVEAGRYRIFVGGGQPDFTAGMEKSLDVQGRQPQAK